jgi:hypothetical protein
LLLNLSVYIETFIYQTAVKPSEEMPVFCSVSDRKLVALPAHLCAGLLFTTFRLGADYPVKLRLIVSATAVCGPGIPGEF